ncbi:hypothetical protein FM120_23315 [Sphingobacterium faecium PCAi_F2.5]|nr:hypothetical protein FM120_23315 [Sphingobacterium faecium PCAi_F2.5]
MQQDYLRLQLLCAERLHPEEPAEDNQVHSLPTAQTTANKVLLSVEDLPMLLF